MEGVSEYTSSRLTLNFVLVSFLFGVNHGCINVALNYATTEFPGVLGNVSTGLIFGGYVFCAMSIAALVAQALGPRNVLVLGASMYAAYVSMFFLALVIPSAQALLVVLGSSCGGMAAGFVWVGEGAYFSRTSEHYVVTAKTTVESANAYLGGIFATVYVGLEVLITGSASVLLSFFPVRTSQLLFGMSIAAGVATVVMFYTVLDLPPLTPPPVKKTTIKDDLLLALRLLKNNRKLQLLYPFCIAFGFVDALTITYLNSLTGDPAALGDKNLGYINTIPPAAATLAGLPLAYLSDKYGKLPLLTFGGLNLLAVGVVCMLTGPEQIMGWGWWISIIYATEGLGRGVFEATCRGVFGDFFPNDSEAAFANLIIASGASSAISSVLFVKGVLPQWLIGFISSALTGIAIVASFWAFRYHEREKDDSEAPLLNKATHH